MTTFEVDCLIFSISQRRKLKLGVVKQLAQGYTAVWVAEQGTLPGPGSYLPCCTVKLKVFFNQKHLMQTHQGKNDSRYLKMSVPRLREVKELVQGYTAYSVSEPGFILAPISFLVNAVCFH